MEAAKAAQAEDVEQLEAELDRLEVAAASVPEGAIGSRHPDGWIYGSEVVKDEYGCDDSEIELKKRIAADVKDAPVDWTKIAAEHLDFTAGAEFDNGEIFYGCMWHILPLMFAVPFPVVWN